MGGWLHIEIKCRLRESNPVRLVLGLVTVSGLPGHAVTHHSTNRAQRRLTSLIETNDVTTTLCRHKTIMMTVYNNDSLVTVINAPACCSFVLHHFSEWVQLETSNLASISHIHGQQATTHLHRFRDVPLFTLRDGLSLNCASACLGLRQLLYTTNTSKLHITGHIRLVIRVCCVNIFQLI